jgi:shikimate kinase
VDESHELVAQHHLREYNVSTVAEVSGKGPYLFELLQRKRALAEFIGKKGGQLNIISNVG